MRNMNISTSQLAEFGGVSQGTVDRALNNRNGISSKTKKMIIDTAISYGYRPKAETNVRQVGVIVFNLNNEYLTNLITEIEITLRKIGYTATVMLSHYDKEYEIECIKKLYSSGVDGIILCSVNSGDKFKAFVSTLNIPIISVGNKIDGIPYVGIDDFAAMKEMTEFVLAKKYENIVYFSPALKYSDAYAQKMRFEGFKAGIGDFKNYSVVTELEQLSNSYPTRSAILCSTDYYALKVYFRKVCTDIYGFDNIKLLREIGLPITSVDYSIKEIAQKSIDSIFSQNKYDFLVSFTIKSR